jgi:methionyl-tRNA formyltransferase
MIRVFFIGSVVFSRSMLNVVLDIDKVEVVGIATKSKSALNADHSDLSDLAEQHQIPFKYVRDINAPHITSWISELKPDVVFCFGWSALIKEPLLSLAPKGVIGYHPAELPKNRGRHPIIWALALGLDQTASTFFRMDEGADSGDILDQKLLTIEGADTAQTLYDKLTQVAEDQVRAFSKALALGTEQWTRQNHEASNEWRKRGERDGLIDFRLSTQVIHNLVKALTRPYVGAHINYLNGAVKVWKTSVGPSASKNLEPGKILEIQGDALLVKTGDGSIWIEEHTFSTLPNKNSYL